MDAETLQTHALLVQAHEQGLLPAGWSVEVSWPWKTDTHLIAPERKGGVIVHAYRTVAIQLPGDGPARSRVQVQDRGEERYMGRGWRERIVEAAVRAAEAYHDTFVVGPSENEEGPMQSDHIDPGVKKPT